jgi:hypothetical protein
MTACDSTLLAARAVAAQVGSVLSLSFSSSFPRLLLRESTLKQASQSRNSEPAPGPDHTCVWQIVAIPCPRPRRHSQHSPDAGGLPRGGTMPMCEEQALHTSTPQRRQWWRRRTRLKASWHSAHLHMDPSVVRRATHQTRVRGQAPLELIVGHPALGSLRPQHSAASRLESRRMRVCACHVRADLLNGGAAEVYSGSPSVELAVPSIQPTHPATAAAGRPPASLTCACQL